MTEIERYSPGEIARPADTVLPGTAERIRDGVPANTRRAYERAWRDFHDWCIANGRAPLPASRETFADYVNHLCDRELAPTTIKATMGAISKRHRLAGHPKGIPDTELANTVLRGYRKERADQGQRVKEAPPITRTRLQQMSAACDPNTLAGKRDRLLLVLGWALAGRRSELAALRIEDVTIVDDEMDVLIRSSKTDKDAEGEVVPVPAGEHVDTDPVGLFRAWLAALAEHGGQGTARGPLLRSVTQHDRLYRHGSITPQAINAIVRRTAEKAGLPQWWLYSAHSLRAGFATQAANDGIPQSVWARHGRWNPTSPVPAKYVRAADKRRDNPLRKMGL